MVSKTQVLFFIGCALLILVDFLWTLSSVLVQHLIDNYYDKPIIITYFSTAVFALYLPVFYIYTALQQWYYRRSIPQGVLDMVEREQRQQQQQKQREVYAQRLYDEQVGGSDPATLDYLGVLGPATPTAVGMTGMTTMTTSSSPPMSPSVLSPLLPSVGCGDYIASSPAHPSLSLASSSPASSLGSRSVDALMRNTSGGDGSGHLRDHSSDNTTTNDTTTTTPTHHTTSLSHGNHNTQPYHTPLVKYMTARHNASWEVFIHNFKVAMVVGPLWYSMNVTYNSALKMVSVTTNTILSTTSAFFVMLLGVCVYCHRIKLVQLMCVIGAILGAMFVVYMGSTVSSSSSDGGDSDGNNDGGDGGDSDPTPPPVTTMARIIGPLLCLLSAFLYGAYSFVIDYYSDKDKPVHEQMKTVQSETQMAHDELTNGGEQYALDAQYYYERFCSFQQFYLEKVAAEVASRGSDVSLSSSLLPSPTQAVVLPESGDGVAHHPYHHHPPTGNDQSHLTGHSHDGYHNDPLHVCVCGGDDDTLVSPPTAITATTIPADAATAMPSGATNVHTTMDDHHHMIHQDTYHHHPTHMATNADHSQPHHVNAQIGDNNDTHPPRHAHPMAPPNATSHPNNNHHHHHYHHMYGHYHHHPSNQSNNSNNNNNTNNPHHYYSSHHHHNPHEASSATPALTATHSDAYTFAARSGPMAATTIGTRTTTSLGHTTAPSVYTLLTNCTDDSKTMNSTMLKERHRQLVSQHQSFHYYHNCDDAFKPQHYYDRFGVGAGDADRARRELMHQDIDDPLNDTLDCLEIHGDADLLDGGDGDDGDGDNTHHHSYAHHRSGNDSPLLLSSALSVGDLPDDPLDGADELECATNNSDGDVPVEDDDLPSMFSSQLHGNQYYYNIQQTPPAPVPVPPPHQGITALHHHYHHVYPFPTHHAHQSVAGAMPHVESSNMMAVNDHGNAHMAYAHAPAHAHAIDHPQPQPEKHTREHVRDATTRQCTTCGGIRDPLPLQVNTNPVVVNRAVQMTAMEGPISSPSLSSTPQQLKGEQHNSITPHHHHHPPCPLLTMVLHKDHHTMEEYHDQLMHHYPPPADGAASSLTLTSPSTTTLPTSMKAHQSDGEYDITIIDINTHTTAAPTTTTLPPSTPLLATLPPLTPQINTGLLFGCIGLINLFLAWPFFALFHYAGIERLSMPPRDAMGMILINAFCGAAGSDFLWANAVILTNPIIATLAIPGTIPMAMAWDVITGQQPLNVWVVLGSVLIVASGSIVTVYTYFTEKRAAYEITTVKRQRHLAMIHAEIEPRVHRMHGFQYTSPRPGVGDVGAI